MKLFFLCPPSKRTGLPSKQALTPSNGREDLSSEISFILDLLT